jgi:hypothetical protein
VDEGCQTRNPDLNPCFILHAVNQGAVGFSTPPVRGKPALPRIPLHAVEVCMSDQLIRLVRQVGKLHSHRIRGLNPQVAPANQTAPGTTLPARRSCYYEQYQSCFSRKCLEPKREYLPEINMKLGM